MNFHILGKILGLFIISIGLNQLVPLLVAVAYKGHEPIIDFYISMFIFTFSMVITIIFGLLLFMLTRKTTEEVYRREALAICGLGWLITTFFGALPYFFYGLFYPSCEFSSFVNCIFESASGFTTTGSTILTDIERFPKSILFWRSYTHWLGGMGIIVLFVAILPYLGAGGKQLFRGEVSGPVKDGLAPRIQQSAMILWSIYLLFTLVQTILLCLGGMNLFDAICHTFGTIATGGFSTRDDSIAYYSNNPEFNGVFIESVIVLFMYLGGISFSLHFMLIREGKWRKIIDDHEWILYTAIIAVSVFLVFSALVPFQSNTSIFQSARESIFQVVSIMTTTGFVTADFSHWPSIAVLILVLIMFIGGCAGSTGGGIKVIRILTVFQVGIHHLEKVFSPRVVRKLRIGGQVIPTETQVGILTYFVLCILIFVFGSLFITMLGYELETSVTSVIACMFSIGPGLGRIGAVENYNFFDPVAKSVLAMLMIMGRLELYSILVLFIPSFWRGH